MQPCDRGTLITSGYQKHCKALHTHQTHELDSASMTQRRFLRAIGALGEIFDFVDDYGARHGVPPGVLFSVKFVVEELFTNMVKYGASDHGSDITIAIDAAGGSLVVSLTDSGVDEFDVTKAADADVTLGLEERKVGGLGLHLVKRMVDSLEYEYRDRNSIITFSKKME